MLSRHWLAQQVPVMSVRVMIASLVAALLAWPLFALLDKLRHDED